MIYHDEHCIKVAGEHGTLDRGYPGDAGFDLRVVGHHTVEPGSFVDLDCGIAIEMPNSLWARICGRSSTIRRRGLMVAEGVIDAGYRGPLFVGVWNLTKAPVEVADGERLAQLIPHLNVAEVVRFEPVERLAESERGNAGFGSTGR